MRLTFTWKGFQNRVKVSLAILAENARIKVKTIKIKPCLSRLAHARQHRYLIFASYDLIIASTGGDTVNTFALVLIPTKIKLYQQ
jgi:hypothetical protein